MTEEDWGRVDAKVLVYMRDELLNRARTNIHPEDVAFRAGSAYWDVVETCIGTAFDSYGEQDQDGNNLQKDFFLKVVRPLEQLRV
jgi:hypothetical protein